MDAEWWSALAAVASAVVAVIAAVIAGSQARSARGQVTIARDQAESAWRSANAAEAQAKLARRQAAAAEAEVVEARRAGDLTEQAESDRRADRHDREGPNFEQEGTAFLYGKQAVVGLRMKGGPGRMLLTIEPTETTRLVGISLKEWAAGEDVPVALTIPTVERGELVEFRVHLSVEPWRGHAEITVPVTVTAKSSGSDSRTWRRRVSITLHKPQRLS